MKIWWETGHSRGLKGCPYRQVMNHPEEKNGMFTMESSGDDTTLNKWSKRVTETVGQVDIMCLPTQGTKNPSLNGNPAPKCITWISSSGNKQTNLKWGTFLKTTGSHSSKTPRSWKTKKGYELFPIKGKREDKTNTVRAFGLYPRSEENIAAEDIIGTIWEAEYRLYIGQWYGIRIRW